MNHTEFKETLILHFYREKLYKRIHYLMVFHH